MGKILGVFEVFLGIFEKTKEKKDRGEPQKHNFRMECFPLRHSMIRVVKRVLLANGHFAGVTPAIFVIFVDFRGLRTKIPCSQRAQGSKKFDLGRNFQSRSKFLISLENFNLDVSISPRKIGLRWVARSKISFSIEIFNIDRNLEFF